MHVITYHGKPVTLRKLSSLQKTPIDFPALVADVNFVCGETRTECVRHYEYWFGSWANRPDFVGCVKCVVTEDVDC